MLGILLLLCLASRLTPAIRSLSAGFQPTSDESQYLRLSSNLLKGRGLTDSVSPPFLPSASRGPIYPVFLAAIGWVKAELWFIRIIQALVEVLSGVLLTWLAWRLAGGKAAVITLAGWTLLGPSQAFVPFFYSEILATFLSILGTGLCFIALQPGQRRPLWAFSGGFTLALLVLTRPAQVVWLPVLLVLLFLAARKNTNHRWLWLACGLGMFLPMTTWFVRNLVTLKRPVPLTTIGTGMNLWVGTQSAGTEVMRFESNPDGPPGQGQWIPAIPFGDSLEEKRQAQYHWNNYMETLLRGGDMKVVEKADAGLKQLALARWRKDPGGIIMFRVANGLRSLVPTDLPLPRWLQIVTGLGLWGMSLVWGRWAWRKKNWPLIWCAIAPWVLWAAHLPLHTESRYLYPAWPLIMLGLGCFIASFGKYSPEPT